MGMFDWFVPASPLPCSSCGEPLTGFQGKDGPCELLVWREREPSPTNQECDEFWRRSESDRDVLRLPAVFGFHTSCTSCGTWMEFTGICRNGVWSDSILGTVANLDRRSPATRLGAGTRQCSKCAAVWDWPDARRCSACPQCHTLTELVDDR